MELPSTEVIQVLREKGVEFLYHANTVKTSCTFMRSGALLSRGTVERMGAPQTSQSSDSVDKKYGIWYDVFLDTIDIHSQLNKQNYYGPILFVFSVDILTSHHAPPLWITKKNPVNWKHGEAMDERWFKSTTELRDSFGKGDMGQMLVLRHIGGVLRFKDHLKRIIVDGVSNTNYATFAKGALLGALTSTVSIPKLEVRTCPPSCQCQKHYKQEASQEQLKKFFLPR